MVESGAMGANLGGRLGSRLNQLAAIGIDMGFLAIWALAQYLRDGYIGGLNLSGFSRWAFFVYQIIFFVSTLAPFVIYTVDDLVVIFSQVANVIRGNREGDDAGG